MLASDDIVLVLVVSNTGKKRGFGRTVKVMVSSTASWPAGSTASSVLVNISCADPACGLP